MSWRNCLSKWRFWAWLALSVVLMWTAARQLMQPLWDEPVMALAIGGTYEYMQEHSTAPFLSWGRVGSRVWGGIPKTDARLRFVDSQYGFETPMARFFTVTFEGDVVGDIRMSPQIEPLLIDDVMKVVLDLQAQWCAKGWRPMGTRSDPTMADTPEWRIYLRNSVIPGISYWQASDKYQAMLVLARFRDSRHPDQERYLITLELTKPWIPFEETETLYEEPHPFPPPQPKKGAIPCQPLPL